MSLDQIAAALIAANRHNIDGQTMEDFALSTPEGIEDLADTAHKIYCALRRREYGLERIWIEPEGS